MPVVPRHSEGIGDKYAKEGRKGQQVEAKRVPRPKSVVGGGGGRRRCCPPTACVSPLAIFRPLHHIRAHKRSRGLPPATGSPHLRPLHPPAATLKQKYKIQKKVSTHLKKKAKAGSIVRPSPSVPSSLHRYLLPYDRHRLHHPHRPATPPLPPVPAPQVANKAAKEKGHGQREAIQRKKELANDPGVPANWPMREQLIQEMQLQASRGRARPRTSAHLSINP